MTVAGREITVSLPSPVYTCLRTILIKVTMIVPEYRLIFFFLCKLDFSNVLLSGTHLGCHYSDVFFFLMSAYLRLEQLMAEFHPSSLQLRHAIGN